MDLELLAKDGESGKSGCPSVYLGSDGSLVVQGDLLDDDTHGKLHNLLPGEGGVRIKASIVEAALEEYRSRQ